MTPHSIQIGKLPPEPFVQWLRKIVARDGFVEVADRLDLGQERLKRLMRGRKTGLDFDFIDTVLIKEGVFVHELYDSYFLDFELL